ncbi:phage tail tape measure protein [Lacihabitans soyangensis]|uniref:Phage tail tape measure protein n=1 Tax=Lacihabitans soyangensis TaxID=869394 RepID=A0AAE3KX23_9BACT|nr:phage tail tape measure protein [Lacihabitans soyangensis]MCP9763915.1 phage tail tape measure protein [Lacihabitans soyangensis]
MGTFSDVAELRIKILGDGAQNDMKSLKMSAKEIKDELLLMENAGLKNSKAYKEMKTLLSDVNMAAKSSLATFDLQNASLNEMRAKKAALNAELNKLVVGSKEWMAKMNEIAPIAEKINTTREQMKNFGKEAEVQQSLWGKYGDWIKGAFAVTGIMEMWQALKGFASGSLDEAKKFESAAQSLRGEVVMTDEQFQSLKKSAKENGEAFGMTGEQMLNAYNAIASGKSDLIDVKGGIEAVTDAAIMLATNGEMELAVSAKVMTESLNQFGAEAKDAAKFVDVLSTGTQVGAGKIQEIGAALKYAGPMAKAAGLSFGETNAALQILHQNGIKGEQAGTALRGMLARLLKGADDTNPSIVGMATAMDNLAKKQLSAKDMTALFGQEAVSAGIAVVSNSEKLKEWTAVIEKGGGAAAMYAEKTKTVEFAEKQAAAAYANSRQEIGEKLLPIWVSLINFFTQYGIPSIQAVATAVIGLIQGLMAMPKFVIENKELFIGLGVALVSLNGANIAAAASALYMAAAEKTRAIATRAGVAAQWLMNAALTANPIGLVIAAIATFTGGIVWAYKNVDWFRAGIQATWAGLKEFVKVIWDVNVAVYKLDFSKAWERLKNGWSSVSKASGDAYANSMAESNKRVAADTAKTSKATGDTVVKAAKETGAKVVQIDKETAKERKEAADKTKEALVNAHKAMLKEIEKSNDLAEKTIRKSLEDHVKAVKANNADELKAHEKLNEEMRENALKMANFKDAAMKLERVKLAKSVEEIEQIEREYAEKALQRELQSSKDKLAAKDREFKVLKAMGLLYKEEEDKRSTEILKLKSEVADKEMAIVKKGVSDKQKALKESADAVEKIWNEEVEAYKKSVDEQKETAEKMAEHFNRVVGEVTKVGYAFAQNLLGNAGEEIDALIGKTTDKVEKARLESRKISNEMGKSFIDTVASFATGDVSGGISGLIGVLSGAVSLFNQNAQILVAELEVLYDKLSADANFLMSNVEAVKSIYGDMTFNMPSFDDYSKVTSAIEASISAEIKVGQQIQDNYELAAGKENEYFEQRKRSIEEAYALDVQRINDKYDLLAQKAGQAQSAESLALQNASNEQLLALIKNEDAKLSVMAEFNTKKSDILRATALADMQITDQMDAATVKAINDARDLRANELSKLADWYQGELVFMVNNEDQKRKEYTITDQILKGLKEAQDALDLKYKMAAIVREQEKTTELVALEKNKNSQLEAESKRYNDALVALGVARDEALTASFNRLKDAMNSGYQEMIDNAERLYQKGIITANQFVELVNQIRYFKSLLNDGGYTDTGGPAPTFEPVVIPRFSRGTEYVDEGDYWPDGTDTVPAMLNKGERVLTAVQNKAIGDMSNEELVARVAGFGSAQPPIYSVDMGLVDRIGASGVPTMGGLRSLDKLGTGGYSSWVSGFGSAQPPGGGAGGGGAALTTPALRATPPLQGGEGDVAGALARNNELMQALVNLVANGTNEELKRIAEKPPLTLHDVNVAKGVERDARVLSDL